MYCELEVEDVLTTLLFPVSVRGITLGICKEVSGRDRGCSAISFLNLGLVGKVGGPVLAGIITFSGNVGPVLEGFKGIGGR